MFSEELSQRPQIVVGNKCDLTDDETVEKISRHFKELGYEFFPIMAPIKEGTNELINHIAAVLAQLPPVKRYESEIEPFETVTVKKELRTFTVRKDNGEYFVENCDWIEHIMNTVDPDDYESLQYFERVLRSSGIIKALIRAGVQEGDVVHVNDFEFEYVL